MWNTFLKKLLFIDSLFTVTAIFFLILNFSKSILICRSSHCIKCSKICSGSCGISKKLSRPIFLERYVLKTSWECVNKSSFPGKVLKKFWSCLEGVWKKSWRSLEDVTAWKVSVFGVVLVPIFPHLDWIRRDTEYLFVFNLNAGKYGPE